MEISPEPASAVAITYRADFERFTKVVPHGVGGPGAAVQVVVTREDELVETLKRLVEELAGADWAEDDEFEEQCIEAGIDPGDIAKPPKPQTPGQVEDARRKELGDIGEVLALMFALSTLDLDERIVFPKNAIKLYERISEPGIDVVGLKFDLQSDQSSMLLNDDELFLIESKVGPATTFETLAGEAGESLSATTLHRLQRELRLIQASLKSRGATAAARRIKFFIPAWPAGTALHFIGFLVSNLEPVTPLDLSTLGGMAGAQGCVVRFDTDRHRIRIFEYRKPA